MLNNIVDIEECIMLLSVVGAPGIKPYRHQLSLSPYYQSD